MKRAIALMMCGVLAACSQTTSTTSTTTTAGAPKTAAQVAPRGKKLTAAQRCEEAMRKATQAQTNAAMLGGALSMVGGFGGLGRGGAIAGSVASVGGSLMQAKAQNDADKALDAECMG
jgi:secreted effector protein SseD